ncbi:MAG: hypothetical protein AAFU57_12015 [Bacteroidota bacterium]
MKVKKSDIAKLIEQEQIDSFSTHLLAILKRDFRSVGEKREREIRVWRQYGWNQFFYPVFTFHFNGEGHLVNVSDRLNQAGKVLFGSLCMLLSIPWLYSFFEHFDFSRHWIQILGWIVFIGIFIFIGFRIYQMEKRIQLDQIYEILDIEVNKKTASEWNTAKIVTRLVMYPLSVFLIVINTLYMIPRGGYLITIVSLGLVGAYLYSDLKILLKRRNHK